MKMPVVGCVLSFVAGGMFGAAAMCLMVASSRYEDREVTRFAGGSGEQDSEPGNQHDEADDADSDLSCSAVPEAPEGSERGESGGDPLGETDGPGTAGAE